MTKSVSKTIEILRFPLIILILLIYLYLPSVDNIVFNFLQTLVSQVFSRVAVPLFFLISGFLFFQGKKLTITSYKSKVMSRCRSLLVPYLIWNLIVFIAFLIVQNVSLFNKLSFGNVPNLIESDMQTYLSYFFYSPIATQFWFIRDLIIIVVLSPLWFLGIKYLKRAVIFFLVVLWLANPTYKFLNLSYEGLLFFNLGCYFSFHQINPNIKPKHFKLLALAYFFLALFDTYNYINEHTYFYQLHKLILLIGILLTINIAYRVRDKSIGKISIRLSSYSFMLFAVHEPLMSLIKRVMKIVIPYNSSLSLYLNYIIVFFLTLLLSFGFIWMVRRSSITLYRTISGGR